MPLPALIDADLAPGAAAISPAAIAHVLAQAVQWHQGGLDDQAKARRAYEHVIDADPQHLPALTLSALLATQQGRHADAAQGFARAIAQAPADAQLHAHWAAALAATGSREQALQVSRQALDLAPDSAVVQALRASVLLAFRLFEEGLQACNRALALGACTADVHNDRGAALTGLRRNAQALSCYERALQIDPGHRPALRNRALALLRLRRADEALPELRRLAAQGPDDVDVLVGIGAALSLCGRDDDAWPWLERALAIDPQQPFVRFHLSQLLLARGDWERGWPLFEARWDTAVMECVTRSCAQPRWSGAEPLAGRTLLLYNEHGFGDGIMLCRFVPLLARAGARVVVEVQRTLVPLLRGLPGMARLVAEGDELPPFDLYCPMYSLPAALGLRVQDIPAAQGYLRADPSRVLHWADRLGARRRPRIGLAWSGDPRHGNDVHRSMALARMLALLPAGFDYVCLQARVRDEDLPILRGRPDVPSFTRELVDFGETAALIEQLDQVISVDTSVAHLAGALGKPTAILLPFPAEYRWLRERSDTPWYASARLYRQGPDLDWARPFERLARDLRERRPS